MLGSENRYSFKRYALIILYLTLFIVAAALLIVGIPKLIFVLSGFQVTAAIISGVKAIGAVIVNYTPAFLANAVGLIAAKLGSILSLGGYLTSALSYLFNSIVSFANLFTALLMAQGQAATLASAGIIGTTVAGLAISITELFTLLLFPVYLIDLISHKLTGFALFAFLTEQAKAFCTYLYNLVFNKTTKKLDYSESDSDSDSDSDNDKDSDLETGTKPKSKVPPPPPPSPVTPLPPRSPAAAVSAEPKTTCTIGTQTDEPEPVITESQTLRPAPA